MLKPSTRFNKTLQLIMILPAYSMQLAQFMSMARGFMIGQDKHYHFILVHRQKIYRILRRIYKQNIQTSVVIREKAEREVPISIIYDNDIFIIRNINKIVDRGQSTGNPRCLFFTSRRFGFIRQYKLKRGKIKVCHIICGKT